MSLRCTRTTGVRTTLYTSLSPSDAATKTILDLIAVRAATDMEELALLSDTDFTSDLAGDEGVEQEEFLSQGDGWLKLAAENGHVVDGADEAISKAIFKKGVKALPSQYKRNLSSLTHFVSPNNETEYRDTLADRATALGDQMTQGTSPTFAYGSPVDKVALMPEDKGLYCDPLNLIMGIQRQISMEFDKDITARVYIIVLTVRLDFQIEETDALVAYENIGEAA